MKSIRTKIIAGVVAGTALNVGIVGLTGTSASADQPVHVSDSITFPSVNPCSGEPIVVTLDSDIRLHQHGDKWIAIHTETGTTSDGYVMAGSPKSRVFNGPVYRFAVTDNFRNDDGSAFQARGVFVAQDDGTIRVDRATLRCIRR